MVCGIVDVKNKMRLSITVIDNCLNVFSTRCFFSTAVITDSSGINRPTRFVIKQLIAVERSLYCHRRYANSVAICQNVVCISFAENARMDSNGIQYWCRWAMVAWLKIAQMKPVDLWIIKRFLLRETESLHTVVDVGVRVRQGRASS